MPAIDLYNLLFKVFLGMPDCGMGGGWGCITGEFTHDFIFSLFLPHVVLAVFLFIVFRNFGHAGLETLLGIGGYIFIVQMGWYPLFASLTLFWLLLVIVMGMYFFIVGKIFPPGKSGALFQAGKSVGEWIKKQRAKGMSDQELARKLKQQAKVVNDPEKREKLISAAKNLEES